MKRPCVDSTLAMVAGVAVVGLLVSSAAAAQERRAVALLLHDEDAARVVVSRSGATVPYDPALGLLACDAIRLAAPTAAPIKVLTVRHEIVAVTATPTVLECGQRGASASVWEALRLAFQSVEARRTVVAASRDGDCPRTADSVAPLDIPILPERLDTMLTERDGPFYLAWTHDFAPFALSLAPAAGGPPAFELQGIVQNRAEVDRARLAPGVYRLRLLDRCHREVQDEHVTVVATSQRPPMPAAFASMGEPERTLFYADYLATLNGGQWALEAMQMVAAIKPRTAAVDEWLGGWGR